MCGIAGIYFLKNAGTCDEQQTQLVTEALKHRGPDFQAHYSFKNCSFFHTRLSILDLSEKSHQPFLDEAGEKALIYNGEIFNYKDLQNETGELKTTGDVEILFKLFDKQNISCLNKLNGFFAFSFYDSKKDELFIVRDRYGVKPVYYFQDNEKLVFASELKALLILCGPQALNNNVLHSYLRLNYCSGRETIFQNVFRLLPGEFISVKNKKVNVSTWYKIPKAEKKDSLKDLLSDAVKIRLNADVPVGCFLSGGVDSSIISALARENHTDLHTFSLGFADEPFFDETNYAEKVANHIKSKHHTFKLKNIDFLDHIHPFLQSVDEPFADSSAFNVYLLSKYTRQFVKVALSGDGADELFMGYNKHKAELLSRSFISKLVSPILSPVAALLSDSRNDSSSNKIRQLKRYSKSANLDPMERYMNWASISSEKEVMDLLIKKDTNTFSELFTEAFHQKDFNPVNYADLKIVLPDDMLVKADRMSMRHGLEIRNPYLDYRIVEFAMNLAENKKITKTGQKLILKETFKHLLPPEIVNREKKGFELPLWKWLSTDLKDEIENNWLSEKRIKGENIFDYTAVLKLKQKLYSNNPGDSPAKIWALIVLQNWKENFKSFILPNS